MTERCAWGKTLLARLEMMRRQDLKAMVKTLKLEKVHRSAPKETMATEIEASPSLADPQIRKTVETISEYFEFGGKYTMTICRSQTTPPVDLEKQILRAIMEECNHASKIKTLVSQEYEFRYDSTESLSFKGATILDVMFWYPGAQREVHPYNKNTFSYTPGLPAFCLFWPKENGLILDIRASRSQADKLRQCINRILSNAIPGYGNAERIRGCPRDC